MTLRNEMLGAVKGDGLNRHDQPCIQIKEDEIEVTGRKGSWRREVLRRVMMENCKTFEWRTPFKLLAEAAWREFGLKP